MESHGNQKAERQPDRMNLDTLQSPAFQTYFLGALSAMTFQYFKSLVKLSVLQCDPPSLVPANWRPNFLCFGEIFSVHTIMLPSVEESVYQLSRISAYLGFSPVNCRHLA